MSATGTETGTVRLGCAEFGFREVPMRERLAIMSRLGFREVEFGIGSRFRGQFTETPTAAELEEFRRAHAEHGLEPLNAVINSDFALADAGEARDQVARARRLLREVAAECGARKVCIAPTMTPIEEMDEARWDRLLESLSRCEETASACGLTIALETHGRVEQVGERTLHQHTVMTLAEPLARLIAEMPGRIGILWDVGNVKAAEPSETDYLYPVIAERLVSAHLKDWRWEEETGWNTVGLGEDDVDYSAIVPRLDFGGVSLIEYENAADVEAGTRRSLDRLLALGAEVA